MIECSFLSFFCFLSSFIFTGVQLIYNTLLGSGVHSESVISLYVYITSVLDSFLHGPVQNIEWSSYATQEVLTSHLLYHCSVYCVVIIPNLLWYISAGICMCKTAGRPREKQVELVLPSTLKDSAWETWNIRHLDCQVECRNTHSRKPKSMIDNAETCDIITAVSFALWCFSKVQTILDSLTSTREGQLWPSSLKYHEVAVLLCLKQLWKEMRVWSLGWGHAAWWYSTVFEVSVLNLSLSSCWILANLS